MLKIRLTRIGKKHDPHYRIIVIPARTKREGRPVDYLGHYNPKTKDLTLDVEKAKHWLSVGAQPTETVHAMLAKHKLLEQLPRPDREPKKPKKEAAKKSEDGAAEEKKPEEEKVEEKPKGDKKESKDDKAGPKKEEAPKEKKTADKKEEAPKETKKEKAEK